MSTPALGSLLAGHLAALSRPLSESDLRGLALVCGSTMLLDALDLVDRDEVARITLPNGNRLYQVAGSSQSYTVHPDVRGGYCPCPAFSYGVFKCDTQVICKHLLAVRIAEHLDAFTDKTVTRKWLAGLATRFASSTAVAAS